MILWFHLWGQVMSAMPFANNPSTLVNMRAEHHLAAACLPAVQTVCTALCRSSARGHGRHANHERAIFVSTLLKKFTWIWNLSLPLAHNKMPQTDTGSSPCKFARTDAAASLRAGPRHDCPGHPPLISSQPMTPHVCRQRGCAWAKPGVQAAALRQPQLPIPWLGNKSVWQGQECRHSRSQGASEAVIQGVSRSAVGMGGEWGWRAAVRREELAGLFEYQALPHSELCWQLHYLHI